MVLRKVAALALEAVLQQMRRSTTQLRTGHASNPGKRQEGGSTPCPYGYIERCSNPFLSCGPDPEHCSSKARYRVTAEAHRARGCEVQEGPAPSGGP